LPPGQASLRASSRRRGDRRCVCLDRDGAPPERLPPMTEATAWRSGARSWAVVGDWAAKGKVGQIGALTGTVA